jgi:hypothetical protein
MNAILPFRNFTAPRVHFAVRPDVTLPPGKPPGIKGLGSYCFKATCDIYGEVQACPISRARVTGYDDSMKIGEDTEFMCRSYLKSMPTGHWCGEARITMLPKVPNKECSGQFTFEIFDERIKNFFKT